MRVQPRSEQGEQRESDEVPERRLGPTYFSGTVEPGGIDEENDACDDDFAEPRDDEEQRREHDSPETQPRKTNCGGEVEHVPGDPEHNRPDQNRGEERRERNGEPTGDENADPEDLQHNAEDRIHGRSLGRPRRQSAASQAVLFYCWASDAQGLA